MTEPQPAADGEAVTSADVEEAIAVCGSARAAVRELLITRQLLEHELHVAQATNSYGFTRGYHQRSRTNGRP